jgi:O-antigen/teichoic acid export membrane protein
MKRFSGASADVGAGSPHGNGLTPAKRIWGLQHATRGAGVPKPVIGGMKPPLTSEGQRNAKGRHQGAAVLEAQPGPSQDTGIARRQVGHVGLTLGGLGCERALTFVAVTVILRTLPSAQAGAFVLMLRVAGFTGAFATLGLQAGAVRLISGALGEGKERWANALLRTFFLNRLSLALGLVAVGTVAKSYIANHFFGNSSVSVFVEWGCVSAASNAILMFSLHHLQARESFGKYTVLTILTAFTRVTAIVLLIAVGALSADNSAATWALLPVGLAVVGFFMAPRRFLARPRGRDVRKARAELARIGRWLSVSSLIAVVFVNLDSLLVARYLGLAAEGTYGAAVNLSLVVTMVATASFTVMLPAVSRLAGPDQIRAFYRRALALTSGGALLLLPAEVAAPWLIRLAYGPKFLVAVAAFRFLYVGSLITVIYATVSVIFLAIRKPAHVAGQAAVQVAVAVPCYLVLIPRDGIVGGAIGTLAGQVAALLYIVCVAPTVLRSRLEELPALPETNRVA